MNNKTAEHYDHHLGPIYAWMVGDFDSASQQMKSYFDEIGLEPRETRRAVDLGAGHGIQSIPLAERGFDVTAIDTCRQLLDQLQVAAVARRLTAIQTIQADLLTFSKHIATNVDLAVCMGDTLTHLDNVDQIRQLFFDVANVLVVDGMFCISLRDYVSTELTGADRFIPVRSDPDRIHTCFLEYEPTTVRVYDILHTRTSDGWETAVSDYSKLRLSPDTLVAMAGDVGMSCIHRTERRGMVYLVFAAKASTSQRMR